MKGRNRSEPMDRLLVVVSAKVNLFLKVLESCSSGYHLIETIFHSIGLRDEVLLRRNSGGLNLEVEPPDFDGVPGGKENLVSKAAERFFAESRVPAGVDITLRKHIPAGAGLGGGSADGAATLRGLNLLFGNPLSEAAVYHMAGELGSDVPFLIYGGCSLAWGRGDRMIALDPLAPLHVGLCYPGIPVSTEWAYEEFDRQGPARYPGTSLMTIDELNRPEWILSHMHNDFEQVLFSSHPRLKEIKEALLKGGALGSLLAGSGSAVFGVFDDRKKMRRTLEAIEKSFQVDVFETSFLSQGMVIEVPAE